IWGSIEAHLAGLVLTINHPFNKLPDRGGVPLSFTAKRKRIQEGLYQIPKLRPIKDELLAALPELERLHEERSIVVHGNFQGFTGHGQYMFAIYETRPGQTKRWWFPKFTPDEVRTLTKDMEHYHEITSRLATEAYRLVNS